MHVCIYTGVCVCVCVCMCECGWGGDDVEVTVPVSLQAVQQLLYPRSSQSHRSQMKRRYYQKMDAIEPDKHRGKGGGRGR